MDNQEFTYSYAQERAKILFPELELLCPFGIRDRKKGKGDILGVKDLGIREANLLMLHYPDTKIDTEKTYTSAYNQIALIRKELKKLKKTELKDHAFKNSIDTLVKNITAELYSLFALYRKRYTENYKQQVEERATATNRVEIDLTDYLNKANLVLTNPSEHNYTDVAIAVALCCGRRMVEIMMLGTFVLHSEYEIEFSGQAKGKARKVDGKALKDHVFIIPTLVPAQLVIDGINYLETQGYRIDSDNDPADVNNKYSRTLSRKVKNNWAVIGEATRFHNLRAFWFIAVCEIKTKEGWHIRDVLDDAPNLLGDKFTDTVKCYAQFNISPHSATRL